MRMRMIEIAVGVFLLAGMGAMLVLALQVSGLSLNSAEQTYSVFAEFDDIGGLSVRGKVSLAGVTIGKVSAINLDRESLKARVTMDIYKDVDYISGDSIAVISTAGLLGEKYISVSIGGDEESLQEGDYFYETQSALNIEKLISQFATSNL